MALDTVKVFQNSYRAYEVIWLVVRWGGREGEGMGISAKGMLLPWMLLPLMLEWIKKQERILARGDKDVDLHPKLRRLNNFCFLQSIQNLPIVSSVFTSYK